MQEQAGGRNDLTGRPPLEILKQANARMRRAGREILLILHRQAVLAPVDARGSGLTRQAQPLEHSSHARMTGRVVPMIGSIAAPSTIAEIDGPRDSPRPGGENFCEARSAERALRWNLDANPCRRLVGTEWRLGEAVGERSADWHACEEASCRCSSRHERL